MPNSRDRLVGFGAVVLSAVTFGACYVALDNGDLLKTPTPAQPAPVQPKPKIEPTPAPCPDCPNDPDCPHCPRPKPGPHPQPQPKPWGPHAAPSVEGECPCGPECCCGDDCRCPGCPCHRIADDDDDEADGDRSSWVNGRSSKGETLTCDFPDQLWISNIGSHRDGAGMCVMSSIEMCALYLGLDQYKGLRDWCANEPGGAYPEKVSDQIPRFEKAKNIPTEKRVPFLQYEGRDVESFLAEVDRAGLMAGITYGRSPRYGRDTIYHMVATPKCGRTGLNVVLDNNPIGGVGPGHLFEWMSHREMMARIVHADGNEGWCFAWLACPPPPIPCAAPAK